MLQMFLVMVEVVCTVSNSILIAFHDVTVGGALSVEGKKKKGKISDAITNECFLSKYVLKTKYKD